MNAMTTLEQTGDVFKKWQYEYVIDKDGSQIRRYRRHLYTRWQDARFVEFVYAVEGVALFEANEGKIEQVVGDNWSCVAYIGKDKVNFRDSYLNTFVNNGTVIIYYVVCHNDRYTKRYKLCTNAGKLLEEISSLDAFFKKYTWKQSGDYLSFFGNDTAIDDLNKTIRDDKIKLDNTEYTYLSEQLKHIDHIQENGVKCVLTDDHLTELKEKIMQRMLTLRPPAEKDTQPTVNDHTPSVMHRIFGRKVLLQQLQHILHLY